MGEHSERTHARFSPSQAGRFFDCPGSVRLCDAVPPRPSSRYAEEGTKAHELLEAALKNNERDAKVAWVEHSPFFAEELNTDMCNAVQECLDYVYELIDEHGEHELFVEIKVSPPIMSAPGEADGHCDIGLYFPALGWLLVIDYKHGAGLAVEVETVDKKGQRLLNRQASQYACGFVFGGRVHLDDLTKVTAVIVQPRAFHAAGGIREADVSLIELQDYMLDLDLKITECLTDSAPLVPGDEQCRWCAAAYHSSCPAIESKALAVVGNHFKSVKDITEERLPKPQDLPVDRLAYIMQAAPTLKGWLNSVSEAATDYARMGAPVPGHKLVEAQAKRAWHGEHKELAKKMLALTGVSLEDYIEQVLIEIIALTEELHGPNGDPALDALHSHIYDLLLGGDTPIDKVMPRKLLTITEADKVVAKAYKDKVRGRKAKKKAAEDATQAMAFLTLKQSSGATMLVPLTDSRPAVNPAAAFEQVQIIPPSHRSN